MKNISTFLPGLAAVTLAALGFPQAVEAESRVFSLPSYLANPGSIVEVPVFLDNAAGLAALRLQVNFQPEVMELLSVATGPLGAAFEMSQGSGEGFVQLVFARSQSLVGGGGRLAVLRFQINPGAVQDLFSQLAIADIGLSDSSGVVDLRQKDTLTIQNGIVAVTMQANIDNAGNGLPDWWEQLHGLSLFGSNALLDAENDGLPGLLEYAFGANPNIADGWQRGPRIQEPLTLNNESFLSLGFYRRIGDAGLLFRVQESANLASWNNLPLLQQMIGVPQDMGDGTEFVRVRGSIPTTGPNAQPRGFLRVQVERQ